MMAVADVGVEHPPIPLVDLAAQHRQVADALVPKLTGVMDRTAFILGAEVAEFERAFALWVGVGHCLGVGSGTDAIELALRALSIGPGDEVIVPANTFVATALAVYRCGAKPVLVDVDPDTLLMDVGAAAQAVTAQTRAVVPVHLYGQMVATQPLLDLAEANGLFIVEDAAQAHGARHQGRQAGSIGHLAAMSFYPGKNLGAYGDAGAVLTQDPELARRVRLLRNYGGERKYQHDELGFNSRMDTLQAVVLLAKLAYLADWNEARRQAARCYDALLAPFAQVQLPVCATGNEHVYHLYVVRVPERDRVLAALNGARIGAGVHYPRPIHLLPAFSFLGYAVGAFPQAEAAASEILSLPLHPHITAEQQACVAQVLEACWS